MLGTVKMDYCIIFHLTSDKTATDVTPCKEEYCNTTAWCNQTETVTISKPSQPRKLPTGMVLVCRDRAWPSIPSQIREGPCSLGHLPMFFYTVAMIG